MKKRNTGITLIALVITIIVLLILAGIVISLTIGENGMINKAKESGLIYNEQRAKEKLELVLLDMQADKVTNVEYNQEDYLTKKIEENSMIVNGDIVFVDEWQFQIDRSIPEINASLGKGQPNEDIKLNITTTNNSDYTKSVIKVEIEYAGDIKYTSIAGEEIAVPKKTDGKYIVEKEVIVNGNYGVLVKDTEDKYKIANVTVSDLTEDMNIYTKEDLETFRDNVNMGKNYEGKTVKVMNDIDLQGSETNQWIPIANYIDATNYYMFSGTFDGNCKAISNLYINSTDNNQALFGYLNVGVVKDIKIMNSKISGKAGIGSICGRNSGKIEGCASENNYISGTNGSVGGIAGSNAYGTISKSYNTSTVYSDYYSTGGIVGHNSGIIEECYNKGSVKNVGVSTGGIVGTNYHTIINCYNTGKIENTDHAIAGIVGYSINNNIIPKPIVKNSYNVGKIICNHSVKGAIVGRATNLNAENNYWLSDCGATYGDGGYPGDDGPSNTYSRPKTSDEIKQLSTTLGEAFVKDETGINNGYPILKWQVEK